MRPDTPEDGDKSHKFGQVIVVDGIAKGCMTQDESVSTAGDWPFPEHLAAAFLSRARTLLARKGQIVIAEGTETQEVFLVRSGQVQISRMSSKGREVILRDLGPGQIVGELAAIDGGARSASVVVTEDSQLAHMSGPAFLQLSADMPEVAIWVARKLAARVRDLTDRNFELATQAVAFRVQSELLRLAEAAEIVGPDARHVRIARMPTHAALAARIGAQREAVSRELSLLASEGLIRQHGRALHILSLPALREQQARLRR